MTKKELLAHISTLKDDDQINFAVFDIDGRMNFHPCEPSAQFHNDPADTVILLINRFLPETKNSKEISTL